MIESIQPFVIALAIGLLVGIERERSKHRSFQTMGVRSFMLTGLLGAIAADLKNPILAVVVVFIAGAIIVAGYLRSADRKAGTGQLGLTTELAAVCVLALGFLAKSDAGLTLILGVVVLVILLIRERLHYFSTTQLQAKELNAAVILLVLAIVVAPFLPDHAIDPWALFNPRKFMVILIMLAAMQFGGYVALKVFGSKYGAPLTGFLGGLISSTAVFLDLASRTRHDPSFARHAFIVGFFAQIGTLLELALLCLGTNAEIGRYLSLPIAAIMATCFALAWLQMRSLEHNGHELSAPIANPLNIAAAIKLAVILSIALATVAIGHRVAESEAVYILALLGGAVELQSISVATLALNTQNALPVSSAFLAVCLAITSSIISKIVILTTINRQRFALKASLALFLAWLAGLVVALAVLRYLQFW